MHKIFYIKKETLCALLLPTLHNPPVLFSAWREFSTLDRSLASGLLGRASSEGDVQSAEMWTTHQVFLTGTSKALRTSQIKQNRCTFASLSAHTRARTHAHTLRRASWGRRVRASVEERCGGPVVTCAEWAEQRDAPSLSPQEDRLLFSTFLLTSDNLTVDICFSPFPTVNTTTGFIYAFIYIYIYVLQWIIIKWNVLYVIFMPSVREER